MTTRPLGPAGVPAPAPLRTVASPTSQALAALAVVVGFVALGLRLGSSVWFAAPTAALLLGLVLGVQLDLRRFFGPVPGVVAGLATLVVLSVLWGLALGSFEVELPYALVPLAALVAFGADWWWIERLRPTTVASGVLLVVLLRGDLGSTLPVALMWFAAAVAALWSLRRDAGREVPTPVPLGGAAVPVREPGAARTAAAVVAAWLVGGLLVGLVGLVPVWWDSPRTDGRLGRDDTVQGFGSGAGSGSPGTGGPTPGGVGPGDTLPEGIEGTGEERDVDGDGIPDRDIDGDGTPDVDIDGDGVPDVDRDGDGIPDDPSGAGVTSDPEGGPTDESSSSGADGGTAGDRSTAQTVLRVLGLALVVLALAALVALVVRAVARERARRRALAARPWAVRLAERLEQEGARRGRARRRDEPVTRYASALAGDVLPHDRLPDVGAALSAALFGAAPPTDATGAWAVGVVDEAVEANPLPTWLDTARERLRRPRREPGARRGGTRS